MVDSTSTVIETIDAWRARGADRLDPVRFRFLEAMARRAVVYEGEARRLLDARLAHLLAVYEADLAKTAEAKRKTPPATPAASGLAELLAHVVERTAIAEGSATAGASDLKSLRYFRSTWSRLSADRRLNQSQAKVPENAGPLNSQHLVHRAITLMRDTSPDYLNRLMSYIDTLSWIEQANVSALPPAAARPEGRKATRSKSA